jgi:hypothetical protein
MNSGSSAFISSGAHSAGWSAVMASYQLSRPSTMGMAPPVRLTTMTLVTEGQSARALSTLAFRGTLRPPRSPSSEVMTMTHSES